MVRLRSILSAAAAALLLLALAGAARADVLILKGNDVPLAGRILRDEPSYVRFQIKGLPDGSYVDVDKARIVRFWREENTYWEYQKSERERREAIERLKGAPEENGPPSDAPAEASGEEVLPPVVVPLEERPDFLTRAATRASAFIPSHPLLRIALLVALYGVAVLLLFAGSRVAELPSLRLGRASILALVTFFFVAAAILATVKWAGPRTLPLVISGETAAWVVTGRLLGGGSLSKAVLLLSFFLAAVLVLGATLFSILAAF